MDGERVKDAEAVAPLRLMQWNILADGLAQSGDFHWRGRGDGSSSEEQHPVPGDVLDWGGRGPKVLEEILGAAPDVVCLQEVNHFDDFLLPRLLEHGYDGTFEAKKNSPALRYGFPADGCAIFYRTSRLQFVEKNVLLYPAPCTEVQNQGAIIYRFHDLRAEERPFIVATTHFKAKPGKENDDRRLAQAESLMEKLVELTHRADGETLPCIVCGDFNTVPTSQVYDFVHRHQLGFRSVYACGSRSKRSDGDGYVHYNGDVDAEEEAGTDPHVEVDWTSNGGADSEPSWTTWKYKSTGVKMETIDYIWISKQSALFPTRIRRLPAQESIGFKGLPSESMPSDHVPLLCELVWNSQGPGERALPQNRV